MKIVTQTSAMFRAFGAAEAIKMFAAIGYDGLDYSMFGNDQSEMLDRPDYKDYAVTLRNCADTHGIPFRQSHAPFPSYRVDDDGYNTITRQRIERAIIVSGILGAKNIIIHPINLGENQKQFNLDFFNSLVPLARDAGVKIALENMFGRSKETGRIIPAVCSPAEQFCEYLDELDPKYFTACLDIGHVGLVGHTYENGETETAQDAIRMMGKNRLTAMHLHDNDNNNDLHTLPFLHSLNWPEIAKALKDIEYDGDFTLEADNFYANFPKELLPDASKFMLKVSRYLVGLIISE